MAFWGTEVKPGRPFTHAPLNGNARLHLSGATLGIGTATQKSIVQCNVGSKRPVFVCCLFPEKAEFCQLNLEFEESDEVIFSVIGPRTVHLTGYYQPSSSLNHHKDDESESYGQDIGETDTEESENSQESEYGGSFINDDDDLQVFTSSPESSAPLGSNEEMLDLKKSKDGNGRRRRLRKSYQLSESENDYSFQQQHYSRAVAAVQVLDSELEDTLPISSLSRAKRASNSGKVDVEEKSKKETADLNDNEAEDDTTMLDGTNAAIGAQPGSESGVRSEENGNLNNNEAENDATMLDGTNAAIDAQPGSESGVRSEENSNLDNDEAEEDATMLDGTNAAIGALPGSESGVRSEENGNLNNNEAENDATMLDGTNAAIDAQPGSESGVRSEENSNLNNDEAEEDATMLDGTNAAIGALPGSESGVRSEEKGNLNNNEAEDDATMLNGTNAAIGAQPESESGVRSEQKAKREKGNLNNNEAEDDATMLDGTNAAIGAQPESESGEEKQKRVLGVDSALMPNNKTKELAKVERLPEGAHGMIGEVVLEQNELASKEECKHNDLLLAASQVCPVDGAKLKRKRKKHIKEKILEDNASNGDERWKSGLNLDTVTQDVHLEDKATQKQENDKKRKKKKRCKSKEDGDAMKMEPPALSANRKEGSVVEMEGKNANDSATQLSNGIIIEELEMGKPDGKVASLGKKVRVHYIGKMKESGQVFDSSAGKPLSKFRLGEEKVPELWNVGLDGMRVGGKRRLTVPPSVSYRSEGAGDSIPPNSWLVFDVELLKVR